MLRSESYHSLTLDIAQTQESGKVCYIILPGQPNQDELEWYSGMATELCCNIVIMSGLDWYSQLTPWTAPRLSRRDSDFGGGSSVLLQELISDIMPYVESQLSLKSPCRSLVGVSLSGLFAIWSGVVSNKFSAVGSVSGSFWYDGFVDWLRRQELSSCKVERLIMLLGDREKESKNTRLSHVESASGEVYEILKAKIERSSFELVPGTHFSPLRPRMERVLRYMVE